MFPADATPLFLSHGDAGYVFDVDGNDYVDLVGGLLPVILGYRDGDIDAAIRAQLDRGISFSLATPLELILSKTLNRLIPSAEMVRFGKNGSDVTSAAVRLARHITKRDRIYACGYHGWHDWSIGANPEKNNGVPHSVQELTSRYYDRERFVGDEVAAVVLEPEFYTKEDLVKWREAADELGFLLVFDEIISGFRFGLGGLQKVHGVIPDLSTFGKSMANGMPISALVGKEKYMKKMTEISYSGTFFGETLSIAAAIATIAKLERENVPQYLDDIGLQIWFEINRLRAKHGITEEVHIHGHAALPRIRFGDRHIQSLFIAEMAKRGVLVIGSLNLMYAHKPPQLQHILRAFDGTLEAIKTGVELSGKPIEGKAVR
jgi:glutamate-1-semialdehyde 2,1-aminomutase/spore coat polysaccharide biosynthesis protein SpsF